ncbi:AAA family ATPase [Nocardia seriolae]|uniref:CobQ/CobB/MinD/ParA nucleotide binding domain-containing protein n=2 Tax=Nocardia seriolae TaxID=37332 RepID=A0ABC9YPH8_9NOCA|nr:AAA family ATPase [Nocardia seriolae]BEK93167.1 hypothetical protein NSER024013_10730 [Nocardia seriolae]GAM45310.1 hypothetical protein NS07_v2contig00013-0091 [Nocardia seriolae]GAP27332.1 hypothetical protein NSK11_contig00016-0091 [Nocardia seriolae]
MSRENDGLPMLPPWLSESDVTDTAYEAPPVQNLPQDEVIPKAKGSRGLFGKRPSCKADPAPQASAPAPDRQRPTASDRKQPAAPAPHSPAADPTTTPPGTPIPQRDPGTHFNLPSRGTQPTPPVPQPDGPATPNGQRPTPAQPDGRGFVPQQPNGKGTAPAQPDGHGFWPAGQGGAQPNGQGFGPGQPSGQGGQPLPGQPSMPPQAPGPRFDAPPTSGGQFPQPRTAPEPPRPGPDSGPVAPTTGPQFSAPPAPDAAADQSAHARPQHSKPGFTPPPLPPSPATRHGSTAPEPAQAGPGPAHFGASLAGTPDSASPAHTPADPASRRPLPPAPGESGSAAADSAPNAVRPPLPPAPGEADSVTPGVDDPAGVTTKISQPPLPPAPGELDAPGPDLIAPSAPATRQPLPPAPETASGTAQSDDVPTTAQGATGETPAIDPATGIPGSTTGVASPVTGVPASAADPDPVPNTTAAAHGLLDAQLATLGGTLAGPNPLSPNGAADTSRNQPTGFPSAAHRHSTDPTGNDTEQPEPGTDFDEPMTPGRHRAMDVPLPLSTQHGSGPLPQIPGPGPQGSAPMPQAPNQLPQAPGPGPHGSGPVQQVPSSVPQDSDPNSHAPGPRGSGAMPQVPEDGAQGGGQWMPPAPPVPGQVPGAAGRQSGADSNVPPLGSGAGFPPGTVPPQLNPWSQGSTQVGAVPEGIPGAAPVPGQGSMPGPRSMGGAADVADPDENPWASAPLSEAAAAGLTGPHPSAPAPAGPPGQPHWGPGGAGQQADGSVPGQMPWGAPGQQGGPVPGMDAPMPWNAPGYEQAHPGGPGQGGVPGQPGVGAPGQSHWAAPGQQSTAPAAYGPGEAGQAPWGGPEQPSGYPGGPVQNSNFAPGAGPAQYGPAAGQYGAPGQTWGANGPGRPAPSLDDVHVRRATKAPGSGWRRAVHHMSGGAINPGMSAEERRLQELVARIRQPVRGDYRIAVLSLKGGVGKTTTTMGLGSIFSSIRGDRVIAVDANPDFGTLSQRVPLQTRSTVRDLLLDEHIQRYSDVRRHTSQGSSRLEVLASERDPAASEAFSEDEYRAVARILQRFYNIILTDCGTGLMHSAMAGVLDLAHSLVLISSSAIDGARSAAATLDWLSLHGHDHLVRNAVVVINLPRPGAPNVGINQLRDYFLSRCRAVHIIPYDAHLGEGAEIDLHRLSKPTKRAYVELAATVADDFSADHRRYRG